MTWLVGLAWTGLASVRMMFPPPSPHFYYVDTTHQNSPEQITHELHMEKILVMFSQFSLLLFSAWSSYFARLESAFSNNKKPYGGQSRVLPLILITNLYSKFRRVFCPDSWDIRYTYTLHYMLSGDGIFPTRSYFRQNVSPFIAWEAPSLSS